LAGEERQLADDTLDVHTVTDLEEAIRHCIPITEELVVLRNAEI
jgi:hypothetical protein